MVITFTALSSENRATKDTAAAFLWSRILSIPFWAIFNTLPAILYKEFHVSASIITLLIALKPATALLATYWSSLFCRHPKFLTLTLILSNLLRFSPFLLFLFVESPWILIAAFCLYMTLSRGSQPAWVELFKSHIPKKAHTNVFALGNTIEYVGTTLLPLALGFLLDFNSHSWRLLFPITAMLGMISTLFLLKIPVTLNNPEPQSEIKLWEKISLPWKRSFELLKTHRPFRRYQIGFMLGGAGLMIVQPVLPIFFIDSLHLSYTEMILAMTVCKGIGFSLTSPFWVKFFKNSSIHTFSGCVAMLAALFPLFLFSANLSLILLYVAFLIYGFMQSGSELSWHMSPVVFSQKSTSLPFSETNILLVGVRGCIIPFLGNLLFLQFNALTVMVASSLLCLVGTSFLLSYKNPLKQPLP